MLVTFAKRVAANTLSASHERAERSTSKVVRGMGRMLARVGEVTGLDAARTVLPAWEAKEAPQPMWPSDLRKLDKSRVDRGITPAPQETPAAPAQARRLPVIHPSASPFENGEVQHAAVEGVLTGDALLQEVQAVLADARPLVQADGGDIELIDVQDTRVSVRLTGNCVGCPSAEATLKQGIERRMRARLPQIESVVTA